MRGRHYAVRQQWLVVDRAEKLKIIATRSEELLSASGAPHTEKVVRTTSLRIQQLASADVAV